MGGDCCWAAPGLAGGGGGGGGVGAVVLGAHPWVIVGTLGVLAAQSRSLFQGPQSHGRPPAASTNESSISNEQSSQSTA